MVPVAGQSSTMLKFVGYLAAVALTITNARFGWTLGAGPLDKLHMWRRALASTCSSSVCPCWPCRFAPIVIERSRYAQ
jgi:hypothetical protein